MASDDQDAIHYEAFDLSLSLCDYQSWDLPSDYELVRINKIITNK
jgi:hypothetical protein